MHNAVIMTIKYYSLGLVLGMISLCMTNEKLKKTISKKEYRKQNDRK